MRNTLLFSLLLLLLSCGSDSEKVSNAIDDANFLLTDRNCLGARAVLDEVGYQSTNARYLKAYASTYACEANYSTITFFTDDLTNLDASSGGFFGSLAAFSTSSLMTSATDPDFTKLKQAIDTLLYPGGLPVSSTANRNAILGQSETNNLNVQALYMILVNFGRWLRYYGNADATGLKGAGSNPEGNNCLFTYDTGGPNFALVTDALNDGAAETGSCNSANTPYEGTTDISTADPATNKARLCQGIVLFNNLIDIIVNVTFTTTDTDELNDLATNFNTLCEDATAFGDALCDLRDQSSCEAIAIEDLEVFSAWLFERNFK